MQVGGKRIPILCRTNEEVIDETIEVDGSLVTAIPINELGRRLLNASIEGNVAEIKWLMNKGAPFTADWLGTSPLHFAAQHNYLDVCELLLRAGISKDARTKVDRTPLHIAASEGHLDIIKCLLTYKADIECRDLLEMTPLHWAVQNGHAEAVSFLLSEGALVDVVNKFGLTPMEITLQCERYDILELLKFCVRDPLVATQNLAIELCDVDGSNDSYMDDQLVGTKSNSSEFLVETINLNDSDNDGQMEFSNIVEEATEDENHGDSITNSEILEPELAMESSEYSSKFTESLRLLQQHGITMLPNDDSNILSSVLELGRSVVLTDAGKEVLKSTKPIEAVVEPPTKLQAFPINKKIITVTPEEFLAMTSNQNKLKHHNGKILLKQGPLKQTPKRIIMNKNKLLPFSNKSTKIYTTKDDNIIDVKTLIKQLEDARNLVEEYKQKYLKKHAEAEQYKQTILMLTRKKS